MITIVPKAGTIDSTIRSILGVDQLFGVDRPQKCKLLRSIDFIISVDRELNTESGKIIPIVL